MKHVLGEKGFTLIELMMVILIIGLLVTIAVPVFNEAKDSSQRRACQANLRTIDGAMEAWKAEHVDSNYPSDAEAMSNLVDEGYLRLSPSCASGGTYLFAGGGGTTTPTISCSLAISLQHSLP